MTDLPPIEARIGAQERQSSFLHARIEELSLDMLASFRQQADYQLQTERKIDARFDQLEKRLAEMEARIIDALTAASKASGESKP